MQYTSDLPPTQDASHHQDDIRESRTKPVFATVIG